MSRKQEIEDAIKISERINMPVGSEVIVTLDDGSTQTTFTRSEPWMLGHGDYVVLLDGFVGGYLLTRVAPTGKVETV